MLIVQYLLQALKPLVTHVQNKPALGGWDIINAPEGVVHPNKDDDPDPNPCFDSTPLLNTGANWVGSWIPMKMILRFINLQVAAIKVSISLIWRHNKRKLFYEKVIEAKIPKQKKKNEEKKLHKT